MHPQAHAERQSGCRDVHHQALLPERLPSARGNAPWAVAPQDTAHQPNNAMSVSFGAVQY
jgi:hypothetical protein